MKNPEALVVGRVWILCAPNGTQWNAGRFAVATNQSSQSTGQPLATEQPAATQEALEPASGPTPDNRYFRLKVSGLPRANEEVFTELCFENGADGVVEDLAFQQTDLRYDPEVVETPVLDLNVYYVQPPDGESLWSLRRRFPEVRIELFSEETKDWLAEWKTGFKPFLFSRPFWVIPSWCELPPEAPTAQRYHLYIEPGMAFGTGTHETTRLAATLIIDGLVNSKPDSLLDVGTGTGVLALVARRMGVARVIGIDPDPEARRTARENLELNREPSILVSDASLKDIQESFDWVVANIIDGILTLLRDDLNRVLKPGGRMVLSGVLIEREAGFYEEFTRSTGLHLLKKITEGEWSAALLAKDGVT